MFKRKFPKIKLVHLLSCPEHDREQASISSLKPLGELGVEYIQHVNPPYKGKFPVHDNLPEPHRNPSSFGCFSAHQRAFMEEFSDEIDLFLVCECDCALRISHKRFLDAIIRFNALMCSKNVVCMSIGGLGYGQGPPTEGIYISRLITGTQCMLFSKKTKNIMREMFNTTPWCSYDIWLSRAAFKGKHSLAVSERRLTIQLPGLSLLGNDGEDALYKLKDLSGLGHIKKGS